MNQTGVEGESTDGTHQEWTDLDGSGKGGKRGGGGKLPNLGLIGATLLVLAGIFFQLIRNRQQNPPEPEEIVFEPVVVSLDEGSVKLDALYSTSDTDFLHADGEDEIDLTLVKKEGSADLYDVKGSLSSKQKVGIDGLDKGQICTVELLHDVTYTVSGTFSSKSCTFELSVTLAPSESQLVGQGCSVDLNMDPSTMYVAPLPGKLTFTRALTSVKSSVFSFNIFDVALPKGVNCPAFSKP